MEPYPSGPMTAVAHLYMHVPFCRRRCPYCDYAVFAEGPPDLAGWIEALSSELCLREVTGAALSTVETLLVGGGTPSTLGVGGMRGVESIVGVDRLRDVQEWTVEVNPEDVDSELLSRWTEVGVTRLNIGVQSPHEAVLGWLGRIHSPSQTRSAIACVRESDMSTWGVDLLFGLPAEADPDPARSLKEVIALDPPHVSLYELVPEPGTPIGESVRSGEVQLAGDDRRADQYLSQYGLLIAAGYEAYEMTAFARPGHRSRHALAVLEGRPWMGLGPGAHSNLSEGHSRNLRDWRGYSTAVASGRLPEAESEASNVCVSSAEGLWARLRGAEGIPRVDLTARGQETADGWMRKGLAAADPLRVRLTPEGWLRLDELSTELARVEAGSQKPFPGLSTVDL